MVNLRGLEILWRLVGGFLFVMLISLPFITPSWTLMIDAVCYIIGGWFIIGVVSKFIQGGGMSIKVVIVKKEC